MFTPSEKLHNALAEANTLGRQFEADGRIDDGMAAYRAALSVDPTYVPAATNLARLLTARERPREAVALLEKIAAGSPFDLALSINYANALLAVGRAIEAEQRLKAVVSAGGALVQAHNSLGVARYVQRDFVGAADSFTAAIRAVPDFAEAHENLAYTLLQLGRYREGWREYEWRWKNPSNPLTKRVLAAPLWDGSPLAGRTLLIWAEQGLGDTIQFARYARLVPKDGGRIVLGCQRALAPLLEGVEAVDEIWIEGESVGSYDCHAPMLTLPRVLNTTFPTIPDPGPYITAVADPEIAAESGLKIGVNWAGRPAHRDDPWRNRSCDVGQFLRLASDGLRLFGLQYGESPPPPIVDLGRRTDELAETARIIAAMDFVITIDTSIAHLSAAMGKPTWIVLPYTADWRWHSVQTEMGRRTPWYGSVRLFRQHAPGDWLDVFDRLGQALAAEIRGITNN